MKKTALLCCMMLTLLSGCGSNSQLMKSYSSTGTSSVSEVISNTSADGFAASLGVVSVADNNNSISSLVYDADEYFLTGATDNTVLSYGNIYKKTSPASITKILTALVALKYGDFDKEYTLTDAVNISVSDAKVCGFQAGDVVTLKQLFYSMLVYSGNDAANAIACAVSGDVDTFVTLMNKEAHALGATDTNFVNPNGLDDPAHLTTAYDLYLIFNECLKYDMFKDAINHKSYDISYKNAAGETVTNTFESTNQYLLGEQTPPSGITVIGGKTGTTDDAGLCLILYAEDSSGKGYVSVILGSPDKPTLYQEMTKLLSLIHN